MKKQILWVILPLLVLSCVTTVGKQKANIIYDESVPLEESAWISANYLGTITGYNGITVEWKENIFGNNIIQIPAGDTLLEVDVDTTSLNSATRYTGKGMIFQYNFQREKLYLIRVGQDKTGDFGVYITSWTFGEKVVVLLKDNEAFVPFLNAEGNTGVGDQIILE